MADHDIKIIVEDKTRLITIRFKGDVPSADCADAMIATFRRLNDPWMYTQLMDYRCFTGFLQGPDVERLSQFWKGVAIPEGYRIKAAVLSNDPLIHARATTFGNLFPRGDIRVFHELFDALSWLYTAQAAAA